MVFIFWQRGARRKGEEEAEGGARGGLACSAQLRGKRLRKTRATGMERTAPRGGEGLALAAGHQAGLIPLAGGQRGHATVTLTMGFLSSVFFYAATLNTSRPVPERLHVPASTQPVSVPPRQINESVAANF